MKIATVIGARPQFIKAASISRWIRNETDLQEILIHTGQHYDENMSDVFFRELDIPIPEYNLGVGSGTHAAQTGSMLLGIEQILQKEKPDWMLVYGDTNSTLAGALAAAKLNIPVAHVEAGLRSFNRRMPEEINRIMTDAISTLLFAPTQTAIDNLKHEGLEKRSRLTGDVMYDSVLHYKQKILADPSAYAIHGIPEQYCLTTVHRAENTDDLKNLMGIFSAISSCSQEIVIPLHPRTRKMIPSFISIPSHIHLIDPVGYLEMLSLTMHATKVLTDSGGLQKEAYFLGVPCITLRTETEWIETLHDDWNVVTGTNPERILEAMNRPSPSSPRKESFGNGNAAKKITEAILE